MPHGQVRIHVHIAEIGRTVTDHVGTHLRARKVVGEQSSQAWFAGNDDLNAHGFSLIQ